MTYGLVFGVILFFIEGSVLKATSNSSWDDIENFCYVQQEEETLDVSYGFVNKYTNGLAAMGNKFDNQYEVLSDASMCTDTCPCLSNESYQKNHQGVNVQRNDPEFVYQNLNEEFLNLYGRTKQNT